MHVNTVKVTNFRLLADATVCLAEPVGEQGEVTTVIVGRNNSGKTSFTEVVRRFAERGGFRLEDFSNACYDHFCEAFQLFADNPDDPEPARKRLPFIELRITVEYDPSAPSYGPLSEFIVDLDEESTHAVVVARYALKPGKLDELFGGLSSSCPLEASKDKADFLAELGPKIDSLYERTLRAEDPGDPGNVRTLDWAALTRLFDVSFISAQRGLDDMTDRETDVLAGLLEKLFLAASQPAAAAAQQEAVNALGASVATVEGDLDKSFKQELAKLLPTFKEFGYPGLSGPPLEPVVTLDATRLLINSTKVRYAGHHGVALPESYSGLGTRNLLSILLRLLAFYRLHRALGPDAGVHLIFIEEPEAHLHPQMQEIFIKHLNRLRTLLPADEGDDAPEWHVQFIVSTHSSHVANAAPFRAIRYFLAVAEDTTPAIRSTDVRDLSAAEGLDDDFLHQYLTLTRCDLFFADAAILIEGTTERLMLPAMIEKLDAGEPGLGRQYVTMLEVGGAYAHKFYALLDFVDLRALIITDLDAVDDHRKACLVANASQTSNATIRDWYGDPKISPQALIEQDAQTKVKDQRRIAFQVPETTGGPCGRTFEDTFILANQEKFAGAIAEDEEAKEAYDAGDVAAAARALAGRDGKSTFALRYAIEDAEWSIPRYLREGLCWLREAGDPPVLPGGGPGPTGTASPSATAKQDPPPSQTAITA